MNLDPFFIIGAPRSGTTMLRLALDRHSSVLVPPETHYFTLLLRSRRGQIRHWKRIERDLQINLAAPTHRLRPGQEAGKHFSRIAEAYIRRRGKENVTHFGEKTPDHQRRIHEILQTFPDSKFVLIYRDGRDAALSLSKTPWMPKDIYVSFLVWLHFYRIQRSFLQHHPQRAICVRYEDLVRNPSQELAIVLDFLGLAYESSVTEGSCNGEEIVERQQFYHYRALQPINDSQIGGWRRELSDEQISRLEQWGGWALDELGYECVTRGSRTMLPWHIPWAYCRCATALGIRTLQRKFDELTGTSFYPPNRLTIE